GQEELEAVRRPAHGPGLVRSGRRRRRLGLLGGLADLDADALELARQLLDVLLREVVLEHERLELGRLDVAALLRALDQDTGLVAFKQLVQLVLGQVTLDSSRLGSVRFPQTFSP